MKNDMKLIMESWRRLTESEENWNMSNDSDEADPKSFKKTKRGSLIVFDEKDIPSAKQYPSKGKANHGFLSHSNKHAAQFGLNTLEPFFNYVDNYLKLDKSIYIRPGNKTEDFLEINLDLFNKIKANDSEARNFINSKGQNMDTVRNAFLDNKWRLATTRATIDFYLDIGDQKLADTLMGSVDQQYHQLAIKHHKDCEKTYTHPTNTKKWCIDDDALSISKGDKLSTLYKTDIKKTLDSDRDLTSLKIDLEKSGNTKEIEKINDKLKP